MGFSYWLRVSMMMVSLIAVIIMMRQMNQTHRTGQPPGFFASLLGSGGGGSGASVNLCPTRVTRLETSKASIFQEGLQWVRVRQDDSRKDELDNVAVEKWFSRHCSQSGTKTSASADVKEALKVFFVNGEPKTLLRSASGDYEWMGQPFQSSKIDQALKELAELPAISSQRQ